MVRRTMMGRSVVRAMTAVLLMFLVLLVFSAIGLAFYPRYS